MGLQVMFYIFIIASIIAFGYGIYRAVKLVKNPLNEIDYDKEMKNFLIIGGIFVVSFTLAMLGAYGFIKESPKAYEYVLGLSGAFFLSLFVYVFFISFIVHYYRKGLPIKLDKILFISMLVSIPFIMIFFFIFTDGYAAYWTYPLVNGINFDSGFVSPDSSVSPNIAWYALCILGGALFVYFLCDHKMYIQYGKHGLFESTFLVAFPAGILGARLFYVIGNWNLEFANQPFWHVFAFWEGGLTILGGAISGIVIGVLWFIWRNRGYSIWVAIDVVVPTILLAQAIGRWGNFFNCEVHGVAVSTSMFSWLPTVIVNNLHYSSVAPSLGPDQVYVPLFLIEGALNVAGYFLIAELFGRKLRKYTELGDLGLAYIIIYGLNRALLEPLRYSGYNMGDNGYWSWIWSCCFIAIGLLLIVINHLVRWFIRKRKGQIVPKENWKKNSIIVTLSIALVAVIFVTSGIILMANSYIPTSLTFTPFLGGTILLVSGIGTLFLTAIPLLYYFEAR